MAVALECALEALRDCDEDAGMQGDEKAVEDAFCRWLASVGWRSDRQVDFVDVLATGPQGQRLFCEAKGSSPDIGTDCDVLYGQLLGRMTNANDPSIRFAAVIRDDPRSVRAVARVPAEVRGVLKIDIYAVALDGGVRQL
ncbi:hypothetical protein LL946_04845 [Knoellia locipacati]|uniref:hypothetical protein n=1 Tax=Knoellia locipacati TaxID=882824 RepID=UPI00384BE73C